MELAKSRISVIMGVYNCADTLDGALCSLMQQTYTDWNLILCDDGSTDNTLAVALAWQEKDPTRFLVLKNETNKGLNYTLNKCLSYANGEYIARMDGDDLCDPTRFEKEVAVLDGHGEYGFVSTPMILFDENGAWGCDWGMEKPQRIDLVKSRPFCHAACMVRREALLKVGGYTDEKRFLRVEDLHLWLKLYEKGYLGYNIQEPLYQMRDDRAAYKRRKFKYRLNEAYVKYLTVKLLGFPFYYTVYAVRPILTGLLPGFVYKWLHRRSLGKDFGADNGGQG